MVESESRFSRTFRTASVVPDVDLANGVGQQTSTFVFELINGTTGAHKQFLTPIRTSAPTLSHDTTRTIKRQLSNFSLGVDDTAAINELTDRVRLSMIIKNVSYPLGTYVFTDFSKYVRQNGDLANAVLMDQMLIVDQEIDTGFAARFSVQSAGVIVLDEEINLMIPRLLDDLPIQYDLAVSPYSSNGSWGIGTNRGSIVEQLAIDGDYFSPWFGNDGVMHFIRAFDPVSATPQFDWDTGNSVFLENIIASNDLLDAPNRYIVISNTAIPGATTPVVGRYDVPSSAPYSATNRGFVIPKTFTRQISNTLQANTVAANIGLQATVFQRMSLNTAIDPRHDSYNVVYWQGENWLELAWSFTCVAGAPMNHILRKTYS